MNKKFLLAGIATVALSLTGTLVVNAMEKEVVITFSDGKKVVSKGFHDTVAEALENEGFKVSEMKQKYQPSMPWDQKLTKDLTNVSLNCRCKVSLTIGGKSEGEKETAKGTVREFLEEQKIALGEWDEVSTALDAKIQDGMQVSVDRIEQVVKKEEKEIKFDTEEQKDKTLAKGEKKEVTPGKLGKEIYQVTIYYKNGQPMMKDGQPVADSKLIEKIDPIKAVVRVGTKEEEEKDSRPAFAGGGSLPNGTSYKKMIMAKTTAYTSKPGAKTASGKVARVGLVAVDPKVIPLGTKLFIEGYGMAVAADTGGAVKGNFVDVYFNSEAECQKWGVKNKKVYILN
ncbi:3D domain-containing protein [Thermoactinomyces sp. DSM 45892]|uniref:3D domain-containing protein n=1 Tax=Thermoactinomyces sp. DSM 45892 TaxID=1882753 RepID=UPI00089AB1A2|nr:3D domain-containing protein [Thermoactinomyces sp. DSM 45892]SDY70583.1 3D (Asp-Asp-Asp) domain-containing protein [Thermoactinomyces sp. DSM 45892]